ncbi:uncharacterized protein LOC142771561 [Rhipicephalus microplus]|uniref:uncharacterized protein LOC142771561 n=1 Tax=Rhipicephalus microplus TaxID=6941 RepID=UPI003F6B272A
MEMTDTAGGPTRNAVYSALAKPTNGTSRPWFCQKKVMMYLMIGLFLIVAIVASVAMSMHFNKASAKDSLARYTKLPQHRAYRPAPSLFLNDTDLDRCEHILTYNETQTVAFQYCRLQGQERGTCHWFVNMVRLGTLPDDECDVYIYGDPADIGVPHGSAPPTMTGWFLLLFPLLLNLLLGYALAP